MNKLLVFKCFSVEYFMYILLASAIIIALVFAFKNASENKQKILKIILISFAGVFIVLEYIGRMMALEKLNFFENMPIEFFHIFFIIILFSFIKSNKTWQRFAYLVIMPICAFAILFPSQHYLTGSAFSLQLISYMLINILLLSYSLLNMMWMEEGIEYKDILISTMDLIIIVSVVHIINVFLRFTAWGLHANYFGTMGEDYNLIIGLLFKLIPVSLVAILPLIAILVGVEFLIVLPFVNSQNLKDRQERLEELVALGNMKAQQEYRQKMKGKSQILLRSDNKAKPEEGKDVRNNAQSGFVSVTKEVKTNNKEE